MIDDAVFVRDGERFVPGVHAVGPWSPELLHGGPVLGLIAQAVEAAATDPGLVLARLTVDLFRPVPLAPLALELETLRKGSRLLLLRATVHGNDKLALAQGTALLLRADEASIASEGSRAAPLGPDGLATESLMRGARERPRAGHAGFHTRVETRWVPRASGAPLAIWFRLPIALVAGERTSPLVAACALSDFTNALAALSANERGTASPYLNADTTLNLTRRPEGEWFCLVEHGSDACAGISTGAVLLFDVRGAFGRATQARIKIAR